MRKILLSILAILCSLFYLQSQDYTWISDNNTLNPIASWGTINVSDPTNDPGGRSGAMDWTGNNGNLWLYGGFYNGSERADLWEYDITTKIWTWRKGPNTANYKGKFGPLGVPGSAYNPSKRTWAAHWVDNAGNLWLFGGRGMDTLNNVVGKMNDLWKYDVGTDMWAWMHGSALENAGGTYGVKGVAAPANTPGARYECGYWTDQNGDFWLFGGYAEDKNGDTGYINDLWKYEVSTDMWTWFSGRDTRSERGDYGTIGISAITNVPGSRAYNNSTWVDSVGNLWLFGGIGYDAVSAGLLNDLWRYEISVGLWTWMAGPNIIEQGGTFGTMCQEDPANTPGGNWGMPGTMTDTIGNFWLFGGTGYGQGSNTGILNNLWNYNVSSGLWKWVKGADTAGQLDTYGVMGVSAPDNTPGFREVPQMWLGGDGLMYIYGGRRNFPYDYLGDMWTFNPYLACTVTNFQASMSDSGNVQCNGDSTGMAVVTPSAGVGPYNYDWQPYGGTDSTANNLVAGLYQVTVWDSNGDSIILQVTITEPGVLNSTVSASAALLCNGDTTDITAMTGGGTGSHSFNWFPGGEMVQSISGAGAGTYTVLITDSFGCAIIDSIILTEPLLLSLIGTVDSSSCGQNDGQVIVSPSGGTAGYTYLWDDSMGQTDSTATNLYSGSYTVIVTDGNGCIDSVQFMINDVNAPALSQGAISHPTCNGYTDGEATVSVGGGTGPYSYAWDSTPTQGNITATGLSQGSYTVTVTDSNNCMVTLDFLITEPSLLTSSLVGVDLTCNGDSSGNSTVTPSGGTPGYTYMWDDVQGQTNATATNLPAGSYTVTVTDVYGCQTQVSITITEPLATSLTAWGDTTICPDGLATIYASGNGSLLWITGQSLDSISVTPGKDSTYIVTLTNSCDTIASSVTVLTYQSPAADAGNDQIISPGGEVILDGSGGVIYSWTPNLDIDCTNCPNPAVSPSQDITYYITVTDSNGCKAIDSVLVLIDFTTSEFIPNIFSPNGDGINDRFVIEGKGIKEIKLYIFSRWGEEVFRSEDLGTSWDGTWNNEQLNSDVFTYYLETYYFDDSFQVFRGNITLVR